jgi:hypothetical protein
MRMIGHEMLNCLGDRNPLVMPIEKIGAHYKVPFEFEFGFDPDDIVSIVQYVMMIGASQFDKRNMTLSFENGSSV